MTARCTVVFRALSTFIVCVCSDPLLMKHLPRGAVLMVVLVLKSKSKGGLLPLQGRPGHHSGDCTQNRSEEVLAHVGVESVTLVGFDAEGTEDGL